MKKLIIPAIAVALTTGAVAANLETNHSVSVASATLPAATNSAKNYSSILARTGQLYVQSAYIKPSLHLTSELDK